MFVHYKWANAAMHVFEGLASVSVPCMTSLSIAHLFIRDANLSVNISVRYMAINVVRVFLYTHTVCMNYAQIYAAALLA